MPPRRLGVTAGERGIAMTDREQAVGDGLAAARVALLVTAPAHASRRAPDRGEDAPEQNDRHGEYAEKKHKHRNGRRRSPAAPGQHDLAGLIGNPGRARASERNQDKEEDDAKHGDP